MLRVTRRQCKAEDTVQEVLCKHKSLKRVAKSKIITAHYRSDIRDETDQEQILLHFYSR
jgi:hypothetical protein